MKTWAEMKMEMKNSISQFKNSGQGEAYQQTGSSRRWTMRDQR